MKDLTIIVKRILEQNEIARADDYVLIGEVLALYLPRYISLDYIIKNHKQKHLPSLESITRARRKLQEQYPELKANTEARAEKEQEMKEYAKVDRDEINSIERT